MTRKQFLGSFVGGLVGLGALASGKVEELDEPRFTSGRAMTAHYENERWADRIRAVANASNVDSPLPYPDWKPHPAQIKTMQDFEVLSEAMTGSYNPSSTPLRWKTDI